MRCEIPVATKTARKAPHTSIEDLEEQATIEEQLLEPGKWEAEWKALCEKEQAQFWDKLALIPKHAQHELLVYLYRLEPRVYNKQGDPSYQAKYSLPITLEQVQEDFGGGRYEIYLKRGRRTIAGKYIFSISGQPRYKEGQTDATGKALTPMSPVVSESRGSELSEALKAIVPLLKNDNGQKAADASIEVMKTGMSTALKMQSDAANAPNDLAKSILPALFERAMNPAAQPDPLALLEKFITISSKLNPPPAHNPEGLDAIDSQMGLLEKLTGKKFSDLLTPDGRAPKIDAWAQFATAAISIAPGLLREFRAMQYERMQWQAHLASKGISLTPPANLPANGQSQGEIQPPPPPNPPNPSPADQAAQQATQEQVIAGIVNDIVLYFTQGWTGEACAASLAVHYKDALPWLAPILSDRAQVDAFIAQTPALASLGNELRGPDVPTWPEFVDDFFWTLNPDQAPEEEESDEPEQAEPAQPRAKKKKAAAGHVV